MLHERVVAAQYALRLLQEGDEVIQRRRRQVCNVVAHGVMGVHEEPIGAELGLEVPRPACRCGVGQVKLC